MPGEQTANPRAVDERAAEEATTGHGEEQTEGSQEARTPSHHRMDMEGKSGSQGNTKEVLDFLRWLLGGAATLLFLLLILGYMTVRIGGFCLGHCS